MWIIMYRENDCSGWDHDDTIDNLDEALEIMTINIGAHGIDNVILLGEVHEIPVTINVELPEGLGMGTGIATTTTYT